VRLRGAGDYDEVVFRGDKQRREFIAFWLSKGRVLAGMNVNIWDVNDAVQSLILQRHPCRPGQAGQPLPWP
jgi:3-phenylpropionate/trans-cinnamate dioxygenase ferredoxin reductase subunit